MKTKILLYIVLCLFTTLQLAGQVTNGDQINYQIKAKDATVKKNDSNSLEEIVVGMAAAVDSDAAPTQVAPSILNTKFFGGRKCGGNSGCESRLYMEFKNLLTGSNKTNHRIDFSSDTWEHESNAENTFNGSDDQRVFLQDTLTMTRLPTGKINERDLSSGVDNSRFWMKWRYSNGTKDNPLDFGTLPESGTLSHVNANYEKDGVFKPFPVLPQFDIPVTFDDGLGYSNEWIGSNGGAFAPGDEGVDVTYQFTIEKGSNVTITIEDLTVGLINNATFWLLDADENFIKSRRAYTDATTQEKLCPGVYFIIVDSQNVTAQGQFTLNVTTTPLSMYPGSIVGENTTIDQCVGADFGEISNMATATAVNYDPITYLWERSIDGADWEPVPVPVPASEDTNDRDLSADHAGEMPDVSTYQFRRRATSCGVSAVTAAITFNKEASTIDPGSIRFVGNTTSVKIAPNGTPPQVESVQPGTGMPGPVTYQWEKEVDGAWEAIAGATSASYTPPAEQVDTKYRRVTINDCDADDFSNEVEVDVLDADGTISGRIITPVGGVGVEGVIVTATRISTVVGGTSANETFTSILPTTTDGNYSIDNIYYGEIAGGLKTEFALTASRANGSTNNFSFANGGNGTIFLSINEKEAEQDIIDEDLVSLEGQVFQPFDHDDNANTADVLCGIDSVAVTAGLLTDSTSTQIINGVEEKGFYSIAVPLGGIVVTPSFDMHEFDPDERMLNIVGNVSAIDFQDTTTHAVSGFVGACGINQTPLLNQATGNTEAQITFSSPDLCIQKIIDVNHDGTYHVRLPARKYNVMVTNFDDPSPYGELEVLGFFQNVTEIDLTTDDAEHDFIYRPAPTIVVNNFPAAGCIDRVIMEQGVAKTIDIVVFEGDPAFSCPLDTGLLLITDDISDRAGTILEIPISNGFAQYEISPGSPEVIAPHFKNISITARDTTGQSVGFSQDVIVTGTLPRDGTFTTVSPEIPSLILRDPPGDLSYAFIEESESFETSTSFFVQGGGTINTWNKVKVGIQFESGFIGFDTESENYGQIENSFSVTGNVKDTEELTQTFTTTRKFFTNDGDQVVGAAGDVFVGSALNIIYAVADIVEFDDIRCLVTLDKNLVISPAGFATEFVYTKDHIENVVIKNLQFLADNGGGSSGDAEYRETADGLPQTPEFYLDQIKVWEQTLQLSDNLKDRAIAAGNLDRKDPVTGITQPFSGNITLSANAGAEFTTENVSTETASFEFNVEIEAGVAAELGFEIAGNGASGGVGVTVRSDVGEGSSTTNSSGLKVGVVLGDDDTGDDFTADMLVDPVYKTPIFNVLSGRSSCPFEGYPTQPRDKPELSVNTGFGPAVRTDVDPNGVAVYELILKNNSSNVSDTDRAYTLSFNASSVKDFPRVEIRGDDDDDGIFTVPTGGTALAEILVEKNPNRNVFNYEGMEFILSGECDFSETVLLSAFFDSPCSDITLEAPIDDWELTGGSNNIEVILKDYDINFIEQVLIQIDTVGQSNWLTIGSPLEPADLNPNGSIGTQRNINLGGLPDGDYNIRAQLLCSGGSTSSERVRGRIKRAVPELTGIPYPPSDEFDPMTDSLSVTFDGTVSCDNATVTITDLATEAIFSATVMCSGALQIDSTSLSNVASVFPVSTLPTGEYSVELCGMLDEIGNEIECFTWFFNVGAFPEDCGPLDIDNNNVAEDQTNSFTAIESGLYQGATVRSDNIVITPDGDVHFQGENSVSLNPGFEVPSNSVFLANIDDCDPTADDPVPCEFGIPIALGNYYSGNTNNAIPNNSIPPITGGFCNTQLDPTIPIQWYQYEGQGLFVDLSICGYVGFDIQLIAFSGDCKDGLFCVTAESGSSANLPLFNAPIGETFYIAVTGTAANESGEYTLVFDTSNSTSLKSACQQIYVDEDATGANDGTTWTDAYTTLQDALAHTGGFNDEIWVADGTYYTDIVTNDREATFELNQNQTIYGGLAGNEPKGFDMNTRDFEVNETILSGEMGNPQDNSDNSYHVTTYTQGGFDQTPILDGVTIEGGYADGGIPRNQAIGTALDFQSGNTSDYVQIPHSSNLTVTDGDFSIEAWVNPSTGDYNAIASKGNGSSYNTEFIFSIMADNDPNAPSKLGLFLNRAFNVEWQYSNTSIPQNTWSHVAISVDLYVTDQFGEDYEVEVSFYLNGVLDGVKRYNNIFLEDSPLYSGNTPLYIGMQGDNCRCNHFDGALDDISLWNKALTQAEISSAAGKHSGNESDLVAYYSFEDGDICADNFSNLTLTDQSPNGHDGTLKNFNLSQGCVSNWVGGNPDQALQNNQDFRGGGLHLDNNGLAVIHNCTFRDNYAYFGGAVGSSNTIIANGFVNTLFLGNTAETGGAIYSINDNNESFVYCTFYGNQALVQGDAIVVADGTTAIVTNSILWGNNPDSLGLAANRVPIDVLTGGNITAQHNIIENGSSIYGASGNNQFADPRFVNPAAARNLQDYRLQDGSPAIDAGLDQFFDADHDGYSRSNGGAPDLGAYESGSACRDLRDTDGDAILDCEDLCMNTPDMSLDFDGVDDHITVPHETDFNLTRSNFTIQAWVFIRDNSVNTILSKGDGTATDNVFSFVVSPEGDQKLGLYLSSGSDLQLVKSTGAIPLTTWTHVAVSFDLMNENATFFINGVREIIPQVFVIDNDFPSFNITDVNPMYIGRNGHVGANNYFHGRMDNLSIWSEALNESQIAATMSARLDGSLNELGNSDLMVYYEFDDSPACVGGGNTLAAKFLPAGQRKGTLIDFDLNNGCISNWAAGTNLDSDNGGRGDACEGVSFVTFN